MLKAIKEKVFGTQNTGIEEPTPDDLNLKARKLKQQISLASLSAKRHGKPPVTRHFDIPDNKRQLARVDLQGLGMPQGISLQEMVNPEFKPISANQSMLNPIRGKRRGL